MTAAHSQIAHSNAMRCLIDADFELQAARVVRCGPPPIAGPMTLATLRVYCAEPGAELDLLTTGKGAVSVAWRRLALAPVTGVSPWTATTGLATELAEAPYRERPPTAPDLVAALHCSALALPWELRTPLRLALESLASPSMVEAALAPLTTVEVVKLVAPEALYTAWAEARVALLGLAVAGLLDPFAQAAFEVLSDVVVMRRAQAAQLEKLWMTQREHVSSYLAAVERADREARCWSERLMSGLLKPTRHPLLARLLSEDGVALRFLQGRQAIVGPLLQRGILHVQSAAAHEQWRHDALAAALSRTAPQSSRPGAEVTAGVLSGATAADQFRHVREALAAEVIGHEAVLDRLALAAIQHLRGPVSPRLLLYGDTGVGKSTLLGALARAVGDPLAIVNVAELAETNWKGVDLRDVLDAVLPKAPQFTAHHRAVVVLDELDKASLAGESGVSLSYRLGKQHSLLGLLGGVTPLSLSDNRVWYSDRALIVGAGVFTGVPRTHRVAPSALLGSGFQPELVDRFGALLYLEHLDAQGFRMLLERTAATCSDAAARLGYSLGVTATALNRVLRAYLGHGCEAGPRAAQQWIRDAADRVLMRALRYAENPARSLVVAPDDLELPRMMVREDDGGEDEQHVGRFV